MPTARKDQFQSKGFGILYGLDMPTREDAMAWAIGRSSPTPSGRTARGIEELDRLASAHRWPRRWSLRSRVDNELAGALGFDQPNRRRMIRVAVARAYCEADDLASACARRHHVADEAKRVASALEGIRAKLEPAVADGGQLYAWTTPDPPRVVAGLRAELDSALAAIEALSFRLRRDMSPSLRLKGVPRRFFLVRIAEVFALWTGQQVPLYEIDDDSTWCRFRNAALDFCQLSRSGVGNDLRKFAREFSTAGVEQGALLGSTASFSFYPPTIRKADMFDSVELLMKFRAAVA